MEIQKHNGSDYILLSDMYEYVKGKLERNEFSPEEESNMLDRLKVLDYLKPICKNKTILKGMMHEVIKGIETDTIPPDYMSISYVYYQCKLAGLDAELLKDTINSNAERIIVNHFKS